MKYPDRLPILAGMKKLLGFTMIELMITVAVLGIGLAIGVPAMNQFVLDNRLVSQINTLNSSLALARSEAVKQNETTVVCVSENGATCSAGAWNEGWLVFVDRNDDFDYDIGGGNGCAEDSTDDCLLAVEAQLAGSNTFRAGDDVPDYIAFTGSGVARCDTDKSVCSREEAYFTLCDQRGATHARALAVSPTGRSSTIKTNPEGDPLACE